MSGVTVVALAALLGAVLLFIVAMMVWQEARRRPDTEPATFVIEDAADAIAARLARSEVRPPERAEVLPVVEWHMQWVTEQQRVGRAPVLGFTDEALSYILHEDPGLDEAHVIRVLECVPDYVASIGAVGPAF